MADDSEKRKLLELSERIKKARGAADPSDENRGDDRTARIKRMARFLRIGTDFTATFLAALGLGWFADEQFGTAPWVMISFLFVGAVIAFWDMIKAVRAAQESNAHNGPED